MSFWKQGSFPLLLLGASLLVSCKIETGAKTLATITGKSSLDTSANDTSDSLAIRFAYRDASVAANDDVIIQGSSDLTNASLAKVCGSTGQSCVCTFYKADLTTTASQDSISFNSIANSITCEINDATPADFVYVRLTQASGSKASGLMNIKNTLTLTDTIGSEHSKSKVRSIYSYTCERVFLQGAGVSPNGIDCNASNFFLQLIKATYNYYLYEARYNQSDSNKISGRSGIGYYNSGSNICGLSFITLFSCSANDAERYGLYAEPTALFNKSVTLYSGPDKAAAIVGYAATSDAQGVCPRGLQKLGVYTAIPSSVTSPASLFLNVDGNLNNNLMEPVPYSSTSDYPPNFIVRQATNTVACSSGTCTLPNQGDATIQTKTYSASNLAPPFICAIPVNLLQ